MVFLRGGKDRFPRFMATPCASAPTREVAGALIFFHRRKKEDDSREAGSLRSFGFHLQA
jgi:hypothetical protein